MKKILVTGGTGYIGSHTALVLMKSGYDICILDNFVNSHPLVHQRLEQLSKQKINLFQGDIRDAALLKNIFSENKIDAVLHFAGLKAVGESTEQPLQYYDVNVNGTVTLLKAMQAADVQTIVFSSSATVYGNPASVPIKEDMRCHATNPYGQTKIIVENILTDLYRAAPAWRMAILRYFNPVGAHESGMIGEDPRSKPNNLMPAIAQVAAGKRDKLSVFGNDYPTHDGTCIRDYIHVMDLAEGHVAALNYLKKNAGMFTVNLGTGQGYSVLELINSFEAASGLKIPHHFVERRPGDVAQCWADPASARQLIDWQAKKNLHDMCRDFWNWQRLNPNGYGEIKHESA